MEENEFKIEQNEILEELLEIASDFTKENNAHSNNNIHSVNIIHHNILL